MKILITGGTGFLGKRLAQQLLDSGHKVFVFSRNVQEDMPSKVVFYKGDIRNKSALEMAVKSVDVVYHLAICLNEADKDMWEINVKGTQNVVELCKKYKIKQLVYMSSSGVLGETKTPAKEDMPYRPQTRYERSKMESEILIKESGVPHTIVRTTIVIGPNLIWFKIFDAARKGFPIIGSGKNFFHLVYVEDVVAFLLLALKNPKAIGQTFHVASSDRLTYEQVYRVICEELSCKMTTKHIPTFVAYLMSFFHTTKRRMQGKHPSLIMMRSSIDRLIRNRVIATEKAKSVLGFQARYSTRQAVRESIKYLRIARLGYTDYDLAGIRKVKGYESR